MAGGELLKLGYSATGGGVVGGEVRSGNQGSWEV